MDRVPRHDTKDGVTKHVFGYGHTKRHTMDSALAKARRGTSSEMEMEMEMVRIWMVKID